MANKTLHSLQFPGLSDVYVVPEEAPEFSSESTYAVGEFVTYQGVLYKCTTAVTTAGSWTGATNWSATDVGTELQDTYGPSRPNFSVNNPVMDGTASPGSATTYAHSDHVHPSDISKLDIPENSGVAGQVLTKTANGSIWQTQGSGGEIIAAASNSYSVTLYANSWTTQEQLIATPTGAEITSTSDGVLGLSPNATAAQVEAFQLAKIIVISQSSSGVVVKALGIVPTINLPCELMIFMKADYYNKDYIDTYMAPLDTPTFVGTPKAPTAAAGTNTTQIATTAFVEQAKNTRVPVYGLGKNLLDNWYFVGGGTGKGVFPVNQRGASSYTGFIYGIDRWYVDSTLATVTLSANGISITSSQNSYFTQYLSNPQQYAGKTLTYSVWSSGEARMRYNVNGTWNLVGILSGISMVTFTLPSSVSTFGVQFGISANTTNTFYAVKLELGSEQTLCHNEGTDANPVWVLNDVPDYEYELYRCMTSTADSTDTYANKTLATAQQLAYVETDTTASRAYDVGEYFCWHGLLYRAKTAIGSGDTFTPGTNCISKTVGNGLGSIYSILLDSNISYSIQMQAGVYLVTVKPYGQSTSFGAYLITYSIGTGEHSVLTIASAGTIPTLSLSSSGVLSFTTTAITELSYINFINFRI